jgi:hypothetical protein
MQQFDNSRLFNGFSNIFNGKNFTAAGQGSVNKKSRNKSGFVMK